MPIYKVIAEKMLPLAETQFGAEGILERQHLQKMLRTQIQALSPDLMVIAEEFGDWAESSRRIDLLCIDSDANLVVVEIKRTEEGGHMDLQAVRYAAMVSTMRFEQLVSAHAKYLTTLGGNPESAQGNILGFLHWDEAHDDKFADDVRIVLASANFSKELTTSVMWLNKKGLDITCVRLRPYKDETGSILLDIQQIIPIPEIKDYQIQIAEKRRLPAPKCLSATGYDFSSGPSF